MHVAPGLGYSTEGTHLVGRGVCIGAAGSELIRSPPFAFGARAPRVGRERGEAGAGVRASPSRVTGLPWATGMFGPPCNRGVSQLCRSGKLVSRARGWRRSRARAALGAAAQRCAKQVPRPPGCRQLERSRGPPERASRAQHQSLHSGEHWPAAKAAPWGARPAQRPPPQASRGPRRRRRETTSGRGRQRRPGGLESGLPSF